MAEKLRRKDLKAPDEFVSATQRAAEYVQENPRMVILVTAGLLILLAVALGVRTYRESRLEAAAKDLGRAYQMLSRDGAGAAAETLATVAETWSGTGAGVLARAYAANSFLSEGDEVRARGHYELLLEQTADPFYRQIAQYNLGVLDRRSGDEDSARRRFEAAAALEGPLSGAARVALHDEGRPDPIPEGLGADAREYLESLKPPS